MNYRAIGSWLTWLVNTIESQTYNKLGNTHLKRGELSSAIDAYKNAIEINPYFSKAHCNLGTTLNEQGRLEDAIHAYKAALSLDPNFPEAHNNLGTVLLDKGDLAAAIDAFNAALSSNRTSHPLTTILVLPFRSRATLMQPLMLLTLA